MGLAWLLNILFVSKAHPCSNRWYPFNRRPELWPISERFEYNPETETYETEWGGEAEVFSETELTELAASCLG